MKVVAIDTETDLIEYPDNINPNLICCTISDNDEIAEIYHHKSDTLYNVLVAYFEDVYRGKVVIVGANIAFDLAVLCKAFPKLEKFVWKVLQSGGISDIQIREKLKYISTQGRSDYKKVSLYELSKKYLHLNIGGKKEKDSWRFRYKELREVPIREWPEEAINYAQNDAIYTRKIWKIQERIRQKDQFLSMNSEALQVASAFSLRCMEISGVRVNRNKLEKSRGRKEQLLYKSRGCLQHSGLMNDYGKRNYKKIQKIIKDLGGCSYTEKGQVKIDRVQLEKTYKKTGDFRLKALLDYSKNLKYVSNFIPHLDFNRVHSNYNVIVSTLRTSCSSSKYYKYKGLPYGKKVIKRSSPVPSVNFQQIPREGGIRECIIPEEDHIFIDADYVSLELACFAQTCMSLFGYSDMAEALNRGENLHDTTAEAIYKVKKGFKNSEEANMRELIKSGDKDAIECRRIAKIINLGIPGGQGAKRILQTTKEAGILASMKDVYGWIDVAKNRFREFNEYFEWLRRQEYEPGFFAVEVCGVWLAKKRYCEAANCKGMQTLGALGVKIAMCNLVRACRDLTSKSILLGSECKALIHDEFLMDTDKNNIELKMREMAKIMLEGLSKVIPDVRISCEVNAQRYWSKYATEGLPSKKYSYYKGKLEEVKNA
jgi:DNA polymerase I-like protein with 3'-5' exonuclease and polymerase domains